MPSWRAGYDDGGASSTKRETRRHLWRDRESHRSVSARSRFRHEPGSPARRGSPQALARRGSVFGLGDGMEVACCLARKREGTGCLARALPLLASLPTAAPQLKRARLEQCGLRVRVGWMSQWWYCLTARYGPRGFRVPRCATDDPGKWHQLDARCADDETCSRESAAVEDRCKERLTTLRNR